MSYQPYPPSEDTFFLLDTILNERYYLNHHLIIDVGTGSGYILHELLLQHPKASGIGIDISFSAIKHAFSLISHDLQTKHQGMMIVTNLIQAIRPSSSFAPLFVFNPPYLPEDPDIDPYLPPREVLQYSGGKQGHETIMAFLHAIESFPCSRSYMLFSDRAMPLNDFLKQIPSSLPVTISSKISWFYETLYTIRVYPQCLI